MGKKSFSKKEGQSDSNIDRRNSGYGNYLQGELDDGTGGGNDTIQESS
jgi:hypothetical protein